jgi:putative membrane protein
MNNPDAKPKASLSDYLAAERTLLAWIRTGLAMMGFGFVVARFGLFLQQLRVAQASQPTERYGLSLWFGTALIVVGVVVNLVAGWRHLRLVQALDRGETSHSRAVARTAIIAFLVAVVGIGMATYLISVRSASPNSNTKEDPYVERSQ